MEQKRKIIPPVYFFLGLLIMIALDRYWPIVHIIPEPYSYTGLLLIGFGAFISAHSASLFRRAGTPVVPFERSTKLVTTGFYRYTRNPMYLGLVLMLIGVAVLEGTASPWIVIPVFVCIIQRWFIEGEERFLEAIFGEEYRQYKQRVRRWI